MHALGAAALLGFGTLIGALTGSGIAVPASGSESAAVPQVTTLPPQQLQQVPFDAARFDTLTARLLGEIFDGAAARGLPTSPLINLALEGAARRANGAKIVKVVKDHALALADSREALGPTATVAELASGASALRAGVDTRTLQAVRASRPNGSVEMPLMVLTDFMTRGIPLTNAREAVTMLSRMPRNSDELLLGLQSTVAKNAVRGPGMALDAMNRYVRGTVSGSAPPSTPATTDRKPIRPPTP